MAEFCIPRMPRILPRRNTENVACMRCAHPISMKRPTSGVEGSKTAEFCTRKEGMVGFGARVSCAHGFCRKKSGWPFRCWPPYGVDGSATAEFCPGHAGVGMVSVASSKRERCVHHGCDKCPSDGVQGGKTAECCPGHAKEGMVDVQTQTRRWANPRCDDKQSSSEPCVK